MKSRLPLCMAIAMLSLFISFQSLAQEQQASYFINLEGDTVQANILPGKDSQHSYAIKYKDKEGTQRILRPEEVKEVFLDGTKYVAAFINEESINQRVFLKVLVDGEASLYKFIDKREKSYFLFSNKEEDVVLLRKNTYSGMLKVSLAESNDINYDDPKFTSTYSYSSAGLTKFFLQYNQSVYPNQPVKSSGKWKITFTKGIVGGIGYSALFLDSPGYPIRNYGPYTGLNAGIFGEAHLSKKSSLLLELHYYAYKADYEYPPYFFNRSLHITTQSFRLPLLFRYTVGNKIKPYMNAGPHLNWLFFQHSSWDISTHQFDQKMNLSPLGIGATAGAGLAFQPFSSKMEVKIEGRYNKTWLISNVTQVGELNSLQLLVGLSF